VTAHTADAARPGLEPNTTSVVGSYPPVSQLRTLLREFTHAVDPVTEEPGRVRAERKRKSLLENSGGCWLGAACADPSRAGTRNGLGRGEAGEAGQQDVVDQRA